MLIDLTLMLIWHLSTWHSLTWHSYSSAWFSLTSHPYWSDTHRPDTLWPHLVLTGSLTAPVCSWCCVFCTCRCLWAPQHGLHVTARDLGDGDPVPHLSGLHQGSGEEVQCEGARVGSAGVGCEGVVRVWGTNLEVWLWGVVRMDALS